MFLRQYIGCTVRALITHYQEQQIRSESSMGCHGVGGGEHPWHDKLVAANCIVNMTAHKFTLSNCNVSSVFIHSVLPSCLLTMFILRVGRDSSAGIATRYGLDGQGIESRWGRDIPHPSRPALGPTQPPVLWVPGLSLGEKRPGMALTTHPHLAPKLKKEQSYTSTPLLGFRSLF